MPRSAISPPIHASSATVSHTAPRVNQFWGSLKNACMKNGITGTDAVNAPNSAIVLSQWLDVTTYQNPAYAGQEHGEDERVRRVREIGVPLLLAVEEDEQVVDADEEADGGASELDEDFPVEGALHRLEGADARVLAVHAAVAHPALRAQREEVAARAQHVGGTRKTFTLPAGSAPVRDGRR